MKIKSSGKRVVGNTIIMYVQLVLNVLIGLVSVRVILNALGESDYGVYDVIAGIVGLLSFISNSLSQSSMRFISVSLGKGDISETNKVFNACFWLHLCIAGILCALLEIAGVFLFDGFLNIPEDRISVAKVIYQCMILSLFIKVNVTPLKAVASSYEEFWYVATVSITDSLLKLAIALIVAHTMRDKLLIYGFLMVGITIVNYSLYSVFNRFRHRSVVRVHRPVFARIKKIVGFASWTLLDTFSSVINRQGFSIMLNKFFGPVMNSAFAVSRQLEGHIYSISSAVVNSMKPQIMKSHGMGDDTRMFRLSLTSGKFGFYMMSLVIIPLLVMMPDVLRIWLVKVPEHTVDFARLLIIACAAEQLTRGLVHANQALGNIKWFSIVISTLRILALPVSCLALYYGAKAEVAILIFLIFETLGSCARVFILSKISDFKPSFFLRDVLIHVVPPFFASYLVCYFIYPLSSGIVWMIIVFIISVLTLGICVFLFGLTKDERQFVNSMLTPIINKIKHRK